MRRVKCQYCGKTLNKEDAYLDEYFNDNFVIIKKYYCNEDHYDLKKNEKLYYDKSYDLLANIFGVKVKANLYFAKLFKEIKSNYKPIVIYKYLEENETRLTSILESKYFDNLNNEIGYFMAIIQKEILDYSRRINEKRKVEIKTKDVWEDENIEVNFEKTKTNKKTFEDVLEDLFEEGDE